jgi:hypothetical protein
LLLGRTVDGSILALWNRRGSDASEFEAARMGAGGGWRRLPSQSYVPADGSTLAGSLDPNGNALVIWSQTSGTATAVLDVTGPELRNLAFPSEAVSGEPVQFSVEPYDPWSDAEVRWILPGGEIVEQEQVTHTFSNTGEATVTLIATDSAGNNTILSRPITVRVPEDPKGGGGPKGGDGPKADNSKCPAVRKRVKALRAKVKRTKAKIKRLNRQVRGAKSPVRKRKLRVKRKKAHKILKKQKKALKVTSANGKGFCRVGK